jgi:hypothetical protein
MGWAPSPVKPWLLHDVIHHQLVYSVVVLLDRPDSRSGSDGEKCFRRKRDASNELACLIQ